MGRGRVGAGVYRDGADAETFRGAEDANSDLAAVRDEQLVRRVGRRIRWGVRGRHREGRSAVDGVPHQDPGVKYDFIQDCNAIA